MAIIRETAEMSETERLTVRNNNMKFLFNSMWSRIYPIGSIYISANNTSPATLFGGTWVQIKDTFLLAAGTTYTAGTTGGEADHTLTFDEMPLHCHNGSDNYIDYAAMGGTSNNRSVVCAGAGNKIAFPVTDYAGGDQPHNNMPPYLAVYMWKRIA